jgi:hypothetical protein
LAAAAESINRLESIRLVVCGAGYAMHGVVCGVYKQVGEQQFSGVWCGVYDAWCGVESINRLESIRLVVCGVGYAMHGVVWSL